VTDLSPHLLYYGKRNEFTAWMEAHDVTVIDAQPSYVDDINRAADEGRYSRQFVGHWLRTEVCNIEADDRFVLYTDIDVAFLKAPDLARLTPKFFACAPEFQPDDWSYFNSGVMLMNVPSLRADYPNLRNFIQQGFAGPEARATNDQQAYNDFYKEQWSRLDPIYNWKPYWTPNDAAAILHIHGPKLHDISRMIEGTWDWQSVFGRQIGDMFVTHLQFYLGNLKRLLPVMDNDDELRPVVQRILADAPEMVGRLLSERTAGTGPREAANM
jgi:hypothetical protein